MKNFLTTYFANDGAGVFAMIWILAVIGFITWIFLTGLPA